MIHGRADHPQTQGTVARLHATLAAEVFAHRQLRDLDDAQHHCDRFRASSNQERPHASRDDAVPLSRDQSSPRPFPDPLPPVSYGPDDTVRIVTQHGSIPWQGRRRSISRGLVGAPVALRPTRQEGVWMVVYCHHQVAMIDRNGQEVVAPLSPHICYPSPRSAQVPRDDTGFVAPSYGGDTVV